MTCKQKYKKYKNSKDLNEWTRKKKRKKEKNLSVIKNKEIFIIVGYQTQQEEEDTKINKK